MNTNEPNIKYIDELSTLSSCDQKILRTIYANFAGQPFNDANFMNLRLHGYSGVEHVLSFLVLRKRGYIRALTNAWGEKLYNIPTDKLPLLHQILYTHELLEVKEEIQIVKEAKPGLFLDLFHALVCIELDQLPLTTKGIIHKKSVKKMAERLNLREEDLNELSLQLSYADPVPLHVAIVLDLLDFLKLVSSEPRYICVQRKPLHMWLAMNTEQMTSVLIKIVIERYGTYDSEMQHLWYSISRPEYLFGQWVEIDPIVDWMIRQQMVDVSCRDEMSVRAKAWLWALAGFGWMDVGKLSGDRICFRWSISVDQVLNAFNYDMASLTTPHVTSDSKFYVQSDFDIIVLPDVPYILRWELMKFSDIGKSDRMSVYRLTKKSVTEAVKRGMGVEEMIDFMTEYSETGVPEHILLTLRQWDKEIDHPEVLFSTKTDKIMDYSEEQIEERIHPFITEDDIPLPESLFQGMDHIPMMWIKEFRSYHFSTGIQMMEQAILWKTKVKLSLNANEVDFIPLEVTYDPYKISGEVYNLEKDEYERIQLSPSDWKELKLIVPNFT